MIGPTQAASTVAAVHYFIRQLHCYLICDRRVLNELWTLQNIKMTPADNLLSNPALIMEAPFASQLLNLPP